MAAWWDFPFLLTSAAKINSTTPLKVIKFSGSKIKIRYFRCSSAVEQVGDARSQLRGSRPWPARSRSSPPRSCPRQKYPAKVPGLAKYPAKVHGPAKYPAKREIRNIQKLAFAQRQKAHEERPTGRRQVAAHASSEREPAGRKREKDDQPTAGRRGDETTQSRPWPSSRALPSAEMQSMPHDVAPSIALHGISSAAQGGSWPRACGDHLER